MNTTSQSARSKSKLNKGDKKGDKPTAEEGMLALARAIDRLAAAIERSGLDSTGSCIMQGVERRNG